MILGKNIITINQPPEMLALLYELDFKIMETANCIEGTRAIIRYRPDLVIAEINTPNLNGLSMARIMNTLRVSTPIILSGAEEKYRKYATAFPNVNGYLLNIKNREQGGKDAMRSDLEAIIFNLSNVEVAAPEFSYSFRQHEWANLIGKSNKKKLLIVEDNEDFRRLILKRIDSFDLFDLFVAKDGLEGIYKSLLVEPDLVLTDIKMPILDGMAMSQIFYILNKPLPIVFLTAMEDDDLRRKAKKANGVLGYLTKDILREKQLFLEQIEIFLSQANAMRRSWKAHYQKGAIDALNKAGENQGIV